MRVQGPDAVDFLNRMLSNDVPEAGSVDALFLTAKARVIAPRRSCGAAATTTCCS